MPLSICNLAKWSGNQHNDGSPGASHVKLYRRHVLLCGSMYSTDQMVMTILYGKFTQMFWK